MARKFEVGKTYIIYFGCECEYHVNATCTRITKKW